MLIKLSLFKRFADKSNRSHNVLSSSLLMMLSSILSNLTRVGLISILARIFTKEQFGLWVTITSATAIMATTDFGIGNALRNNLSKLRIAGDRKSDEEGKSLFLSVLYFFLLVTLVISFLLIAFSNYIPYHQIFNTQNLALQKEGVTILLIVQVIFLISIPLGIGSTMFFAYGESSKVALFSIFNGMASLVLISIIAFTGKSVVAASIAYFVIQFFISLIGTVVFIKRRKWRLTSIPFKKVLYNVKKLFAVSIAFAILQFGGIYMYNAMTIIVTARINLTEAAEFNLVQKLYTFMIALYLSLYNPLWAGFSEAFHKQEWLWIRNTLIRVSLATILLFSFTLLILTKFGNFFLSILGGDGYFSQPNTFLFLGLWALFYCLYSIAVSFLSASGKIRSITILTALLTLTYTHFGIKFCDKWNTLGISIWSALVFFILTIAAYYQGFKIVNRSSLQIND